MTHYEEDITFGAGVTYAAGGLVLSVIKGAQIELVDHITVKSTSSAVLGGSTVNVQAVQKSESGQSFKIRSFQVGGTSGALTELPSGSTALQSVPLHVSYEGT